ncbi:MAG: cupin domain-containing protein [Candidatus Omnitrophota bacterium]
MKIGSMIKKVRKQKNITLEELSVKSGVALATLSRIENDKMTGTIDSHTAICKALDISITELYKELEDSAKIIDSVPLKDRVEQFSRANNVVYELLITKPHNKKIMPLIIRIEPGGRTDEEQTQPGIEKFIYVLKGLIIVKIGNETCSLNSGDSLYFDASLAHSFSNTSGAPVEALCVISPPSI